MIPPPQAGCKKGRDHVKPHLFFFIHFFAFLLLDSLSKTDAFRTLQAPHPLAPKRRRPTQTALWSRKSTTISQKRVQALEEVGSGSYGTVHMLEVQNPENGKTEDVYIGKRAWTAEDLERLQPHASKSEIQERAKRCRVYWETEVHCFKKIQRVERQKINNDSTLLRSVTAGLPYLHTTMRDDNGHEWMIFDVIEAASLMEGCSSSTSTLSATPALSLQDFMEMDMLEQHKISSHHLFLLSHAMGVPTNVDQEDEDDVESIAATLDKIFEGLLEILVEIHDQSIVHRDVKPSNLLISKEGKVHLIDFGSAADLDTVGPMRKNIGLSERVAISPIYAAPEVFVDASVTQSALKFDCFSVALLVCQLLFQYLDERTDAGFHQQLQSANWKLDTWLATELAGKVRPAFLDAALQVLARRPGLWALLQDMLRPDPWERVDSKRALNRFRRILNESPQVEPDSSVIAKADGVFLADVLEAMEFCKMPELYEADQASPLTVRPLHFVATFRRQTSLGLLLAELDGVNLEEDFDNDNARQQWQRATRNAVSGEVFVSGVVPESQADRMGIFEIGDRVQGVGELPLADRGFEVFVQLLREEATPDPKYITIHFDRKSYAAGITEPEGAAEVDASTSLILPESPIRVTDQAAWTNQGKRKSQEDRFVLTELRHPNDRAFVLAGVLDGHLGTAASSSVQEEFPVVFTQAMSLLPTQGENQKIEELLRSTWETVCDSYRTQCDLDMDGGCRVADYDSREGILDANTGSKDAVAGTTANFIAVDVQRGRLAVLNCGDSRSFVLSGSKVVYESYDHKPERDIDRFLEELENNPSSLYKIPQCRFSRWFVPVGNYEYGVSRSLEGPFATARGIVSDPDIKVLRCVPDSTAVVATDGLWEVIDTQQAAAIVSAMRYRQGSNAADIAKTLVSKAIENGSTDNVSVVVLFLD